MKNLLIYVNPNGFDTESEKLVHIQIENSLDLGWKREDILLVTDFPYSYLGVDSIRVDQGFCDFKKEASKITTIVHLFDTLFFTSDELYWCHDLDAFQLDPIEVFELGLRGFAAGFCDYGRIDRWQMGSFFFRKTSEDIFRLIASRMKPGFNDEDVMVEITNQNILHINERIKRLNGRYDFGMRRIAYCYDKAEKPLKVLHFHPESTLHNTLAIAMHGRNSLHRPLMNDRLITIFNRHGYI